jgi:hypothetical protein
MYIFTCYVRTKSFHEISTCHLSCVRKTKFCVKNKVFCETYFVIFTSTIKKIVFAKLYECTSIVKIYMRSFGNYKYIFWLEGHMHSVVIFANNYATKLVLLYF